jgi:RNA polymerase sigma-70 factor, ECF subfamily
MDSVETIWKNIEDKLRLFILGRIPDKDVAADILQEVFLKIHKNINSLKDENKVNSWIFRIASFTIYDYYRHSTKENKMKNQFEVDEIDEDVPLVMDEAVTDMIKMMKYLPREHFEAISAIELEGLSILEYAQKAGISYTAAKTRFHRSKKELKKLLFDCCHYEFDKYGTVYNITPNCNKKNEKAN